MAAQYNDSTINGSQSDWLAVARFAHEESTTYFNGGIRRDIEQDIRQFQGLHPSGSKYLSEGYRARSRFFRPKTRSAIRKNEAVAAAALFSNTDVVEVSPWDEGDETQRASSCLHKELLNLRLKRSIPWFLNAVGAYQDAMTVGLCCSYQYWNFNPAKGKDEPAMRLVPIENLRFDPSAEWTDIVGTSPYLIEMISMYVKDVRARMKPNLKTGEQRWKTLTDAELLVSVKSYSDSIRLQRETGRMDSQAQATAITPYQRVWVHRNIAEIDGVDYLWYTLGVHACLTEGKPLDSAYWHGMRPYVIGYCVVETHKAYPPGVSRLTREIQAELNENANQRSDNVKLAMNKRYFAKRGAQIDLRSLTRSVPNGVTLMNDPEKDVIPQETRDVTGSAYQEQDRLNQDFDEISGTFTKSATGDRNDLSSKVGGAELLTEDGNLIEGYQLRTWVETWVEPVLYQFMRLNQHYETDHAVLQLCAQKASAANGKQPIRVDDNLLMQDLSLTCHVGIGATSPKMQLQNLLLGFRSIVEILKDGTLDKYGLEPDALIDEVFGKLGYKDASRFFDWQSNDPKVSALQGQVQELQQALARKEDPTIVAAKVKKLEAEVRKIEADKVESGVRAAYGAMEAGEVIAAVPQVAPIADMVMQAAGYVRPTPPGTDPGFSDAPMANAAALTVDPVKDKRTGVGFQPGANPAEQGQNVPPGVPVSTDPLSPKMPSSPMAGVNHGIETQRY